MPQFPLKIRSADGKFHQVNVSSELFLLKFLISDEHDNFDEMMIINLKLRILPFFFLHEHSPFSQPKKQNNSFQFIMMMIMILIIKNIHDNAV